MPLLKPFKYPRTTVPAVSTDTALAAKEKIYEKKAELEGEPWERPLEEWAPDEEEIPEDKALEPWEREDLKEWTKPTDWEKIVENPFVVEAIMKPGAKFAENVLASFGGTAQVLDMWCQYLESKGIGSRGKLFEDLSNTWIDGAQTMSDYVDQRGGMNAVASYLYTVAGHLAGELPLIGAVGLPVYFGATAGAERIAEAGEPWSGVEKGKGVIGGAARGYVFQRGLKTITQLPRGLRYSTAFTAGVAESATAQAMLPSGDREWYKVPVDGGVLTFLTRTGPKGKAYAKDFYENVAEHYGWRGRLKDLEARRSYFLMGELMKESAARDKSVDEILKEAVAKDPNLIKLDLTRILGDTKMFIKEGEIRSILSKDPEWVIPEIGKSDGTIAALQIGVTARQNPEFLTKLKTKTIEAREAIREAKTELEKNPSEEASHNLSFATTRFQLYQEGVQLAEGTGAGPMLAERAKRDNIQPLEKQRVFSGKEMERLKELESEYNLLTMQKKALETEDLITRILEKEELTKDDLIVIDQLRKGEQVEVDRIEKAIQEDQLLKARKAEEPAKVEEPEPYEPTVGQKIQKLMEEQSKVKGVTDNRDLNTSDYVVKETERLELKGKYDEMVAQGVEDILAGRPVRRSMMEIFDVQAPFNKIGCPLTGFAIKVAPSVVTDFENHGLYIMKRIAKTLKHDDEMGLRLALIHESKWAQRQLKRELKDDPARYDRVMEAVKIYENDLYKVNLEAYKKEGGLRRGFKERLLEEANEQLERAKEQKVKGAKKKAIQEEKVESLKFMIKRINQMSFGHIPSALWFEHSMQKDPVATSKVLKSFMSIKGAKRRETFMLRDLLETEVVDPRDLHYRVITSSYSRRTGKDIAQLRVFNAMVKEGLAIDAKGKVKAPDHYEQAPYTSPIFYGYKIHPSARRWIHESFGEPYYNNVVSRGARKLMSGIKMYRFTNPFFISTYDVIQGMELGSFTSKDLAMHFSNAVKDARNFSYDWRLASQLGARSHPFSNQWANYQVDAFRATTKFSQRFQKVLEDFQKADGKGKIDMWWKGHGITSNIYNASWDMAWYLDGIMRQTTYRYFKYTKGWSSKDAAQMAALGHGDYASVPAKWREAFNHVWFTPTFKIVMAKFHYQMWKGAFSEAQSAFGMKPGEARNRALTKSLIRTVGMIVAYDLLMLSQGFEREDYGVKYKKEIVVKGEPKDIIVGHSGPANMWLKFSHRAYNSMTNPLIDNRLKSLFRSNKYEIHPTWLIVSGIMDNKTSQGEEIYNQFDDTPTAVMKGVVFLLRESIPLFKEAGRYAARMAEDESDFQESIEMLAGVKEEEDARRELQKAMGKTFEILTSPLLYKYLRTTTKLRAKRKIESMRHDFLRDAADPKKKLNAGSIEVFLQRAMDIVDFMELESDEWEEIGITPEEAKQLEKLE